MDETVLDALRRQRIEVQDERRAIFERLRLDDAEAWTAGSLLIEAEFS